MGYEKVQYYTIQIEGRSMSEFRNFVTRMKTDPRNSVELSELNRYIERIGEKYGAEPNHFRHEDAADGLPPPYHQFIESEDPYDFGLRLYCNRLSSSIVILLNGDRKTALKAQLCPQCSPHFELARKLAKKIDKAIVEGFIEIDHEHREIVIDTEFTLSI